MNASLMPVKSLSPNKASISMPFRHADKAENTNEQSGGTPGSGLVWSAPPPPPHPYTHLSNTHALAHTLKLGSSPDPVIHTTV